jgi:hypothetical protein
VTKPSGAWGAVGEGGALLLAPPHVPSAGAAPPPTGSPLTGPLLVRGQMDRDVVYRALTYAFLPRARACYLNRAIKTARDFQLTGRVRLELHLERGEMTHAVTTRSTLSRPDIEACLREAAYSVEIPRALHNDAPVIAALNLVFQPRTPPKQPEMSPMGQEIDLILGPLPTDSDPMQLVEPTSAGRPSGHTP